MKRLFPLLLLPLLISAFACTKSDSEPENKPQNSSTKLLTEARFEVIDEAFNKVFDVDAEVEILAEGHSWTEGPLWVPSEERVLYSDIPNNAIYSWKEGEGSTLWLENAGGVVGREGSNGLLLNEAGQLVLCQHGARQIALMNTSLDSPKADFTTISARYMGKKLNSPNDAVYASNGDLYFTDPPYGLESEEEKELSFNGVYRIATDGTTTLLIDTFTRPNGIGLSPDEKQLIVANSDPEKALWKIFDLKEDYTLTNERLLFDATDWVSAEMPGLPDGLKVSRKGYVFATGPGGLYVFSPTYELLGMLHTGRPTANIAIDHTESYIYLTANKLLLRVPLKASFSNE